MTRPLRVFLCHASQDKPMVRELYQRLKAEKWIDPWLDVARLLPGQVWWKVIEKAVEDADVVIICLSSQSVSKEGVVQREIKYAYGIALDKLDESIFLIPLRLDDCIVPRRLRDYQWLDYFGNDKENAYSKLLEALNHRYEQVLVFEAEELKRKQLEQQKKEEGARRLAAEKYKRERKAREEKEKEKLEKKEEILRKKQEREAKKKVDGDLNRKKRQEFVGQILKLFSSNSRWLSIGGVVFIGLVCVLFAGSYLFQNLLNLQTATPTLVATSTSLPSTIISEKDGMTLVYVQAGEFTMGSNDGDSDEQPIHQVYLDSFWIDQTEVTNAMYAKCVIDGKCDSPSTTNHFNNFSYANHPVVYVNWHQASNYCSWAGRRLPTEAEWEKAARGPDGNIYPWGNTNPNDTLLNYARNVGDTTRVGSYLAGIGPYGAHDMAGNVWEWVNDWYSDTYYQNPPLPNPSGPNSGLYRTMRGGSWSYNNSVHSAIRSSANPSSSYYFLGFRCASSP